VSCARRKLTHRARARDLYVSPLFKKSSAVARQHFDAWYILSAKHGLVDPDEILEPYDVTLSSMSLRERQEWGTKAFLQFRRVSEDSDRVTFLAGEMYRQPLIPYLEKCGNSTYAPMAGLSIGKQLRWLNLVLSSKERLKHIDRFYELIWRLRDGLGGYRVLGECTGYLQWPTRGVYIVFEFGEKRALRRAEHRVVRIGTHAVSKGAKSTLWGRLRTHRGTGEGYGNHRSSVFRLHCGLALINRSAGALSVPTWGVGQSASGEIRAKERPVERLVSDHIGNMMLLWLNVPDQPGVESDRSYLEMNSIALLSGVDGPIDIASHNWLGEYRDHEAITHSGLWNVDYVYDSYDPRFLEVLAYYVDVTIGYRPEPHGSVAPNGWYANRKNGPYYVQPPLFEGGNRAA